MSLKSRHVHVWCIAAVFIVMVASAAIVSAAEPPKTPGYTPAATPFDNPATLTQQTPSIPSSPDCTIRPQTVVEIERMRESASRISQMVEAEVQIMNKRKAYIEQMTAYLNDRIRELNKVKGELAEESRWIEASTSRIDELAQREKLIKLNDILSCLQHDESKLSGEATSKSDMIRSLQDQAKIVESKIATIKAEIDKANGGHDVAP